ncbi:Spermidine synthase [Ferrimonas sediminum]|uniref:Spermidine synthase n=1 Tax=Ferrimonas sediminum TaxID=718193 RepID=A0A1G8R3A2_9GAMM|nr:methyltransferase domain-containing protein [Ferrimonas sediminum]SDJ11456.1 Spermidine synthase [Ferrimonas sediminum]
MNSDSILFDGRDDWGQVQVIEQGSQRLLCFGPSDEQSRIITKQPWVLQHEYTRAMLLGLLFVQPKRALVLGVGGGCLISALVHAVKGIKITGVELRPLVTEMARTHFRMPQSKRIDIVHQEAGAFLAAGEHKKVDLLFADLYGADAVDDVQLQPRFIDDAAALLKEQGMLVLNCWEEHRYHDGLKTALAAHFPHCHSCPTADGNLVILAGRTSQTLSLAQLREKAQQLAPKLGYPLADSLGRLEPWD